MLTPEPGNRAFFGQNVLQGLVDGLDDFAHERQPRRKRRTHRIGAPVLLGCSPRGKRLCPLPRSRSFRAPASSSAKRWALRPRRRGVLALDFPDIGYRKTVGKLPPIVHAKLALVGNICWTDEHPSGVLDDYLWSAPRRPTRRIRTLRGSSSTMKRWPPQRLSPTKRGSRRPSYAARSSTTTIGEPSQTMRLPQRRARADESAGMREKGRSYPRDSGSRGRQPRDEPTATGHRTHGGFCGPAGAPVELG